MPAPKLRPVRPPEQSVVECEVREMSAERRQIEQEGIHELATSLEEPSPGLVTNLVTNSDVPAGGCRLGSGSVQLCCAAK